MAAAARGSGAIEIRQPVQHFALAAAFYALWRDPESRTDE